MESPAAANCGAPKNDLAGSASISSEFIASLPPIQADPVAERKFALDLAARVFGHPVVSGRRRRVWRARIKEQSARKYFERIASLEVRR
jgi:hypothetical protein